MNYWKVLSKAHTACKRRETRVDFSILRSLTSQQSENLLGFHSRSLLSSWKSVLEPFVAGNIGVEYLRAGSKIPHANRFSSSLIMLI
jgi:hypothetical protein